MDLVIKKNDYNGYIYSSVNNIFNSLTFIAPAIPDVKTVSFYDNQTITGTFTDQLIVPTTNQCNGANRSYDINIIDAKVVECSCCQVIIKKNESRESGLGSSIVVRPPAAA